jgi:hypothetical protein
VISSQRKKAIALCASVLGVAFAMLGLAGSASATLTGEFTKFEQCPYDNPEVKKCLYSPTEGGEVVLGSKAVPIVNTAILQGGAGEANEITGVSKFYGAKNGVTLSKAAQPVPGGLVGLVPPASAPPLVKAALKLALENGFTGVNSTLELARPASEIVVNESAIGEELGVALELPVKIHLENPFLGNNCYVGSSASPIIWKLTTGKTAPPAPNEPIKGFSGDLTLLEEGSILRLDGNVLVDNAWSAPEADGCGGVLLEGLVDPIVNLSSGLPAAAGKNTAILENTVYAGSAFATRENDENN